MNFSHCPKCLSIRMFEKNKCQTCGYISSVNRSIEVLYPTKKDTPKTEIKPSSGRSTNDSEYVYPVIFDYCDTSSGSDGGCNE